MGRRVRGPLETSGGFAPLSGRRGTPTHEGHRAACPDAASALRGFGWAGGALEAVPVTTVPAPTPGLRVLCGRLCWGLGCTDGPRHARGQGPIPARAGPEPSAAPVRTRLVR